MKKYIQPKTEFFVYEAENMIATSVEFDHEAGEQQLTNKKDMWGKESIWD